MELKFPIRNINPKKAFSDKIVALGLKPTIQRIIVSIDILNTKGENFFSVDGIFDTGAPFCLLPVSIMKDMGDLQTVSHTVHGIVDTPACRISAELAVMSLRFRDPNNVSPSVKVLTAFVDEEVPVYIIGMKGILNENNIQITLTDNEMIIRFRE